MFFSAIFYREFEIAKTHCANFFLSFFSNLIFIIALFLIFKGSNYFSNLDKENFCLLSYIFLIIQNQIFFHIYDSNDKIEKVFEYTFLTFNLRFSVFLSRLFFNLLFSGFFLIIFYLFSAFSFSSIRDLIVFCLSFLTVLYNNLVMNFVISRSNERFIGYFLQILLIVINFPAIFFVTHADNIFLILSSMIFAFLNSCVAEYFLDLN